MRMVCPACSAAYEVPDSLLAPGRVVRCARCSHEWIPSAAQAAPEPQVIAPPPVPAASWPETEVIVDVEPEPPAAPVPEAPRFTAMDRLALHRANLESNPLPLRIAWTATIIALLILVAAAWIWRAELMHAWPPSQRLYHPLGVMQTPSTKP